MPRFRINANGDFERTETGRFQTVVPELTPEECRARLEELDATRRARRELAQSIHRPRHAEEEELRAARRLFKQ